MKSNHSNALYPRWKFNNNGHESRVYLSRCCTVCVYITNDVFASLKKCKLLFILLLVYPYVMAFKQYYFILLYH